MENTVMVDSKKRAQRKSEFAKEQVENLQKLKAVNGDFKVAKQVLKVCKPGQVQLAIAIYKNELQKYDVNDKMTRAQLKALADGLYADARHLEMFADCIDEDKKVSPAFFPEILLEAKNGWRAKRAVEGAAKLLELYADKISMLISAKKSKA